LTGSGAITTFDIQTASLTMSVGKR